MNQTHRPRLLAAAAALALAAWTLPARAEDGDDPAPAGAPKVMLDKSPAVVAFQLKRLSVAQLSALDRNADAPKYKPVYQAILVRKGVDKKLREEAVEALAKLDKADPVAVLLAGIGKVADDDKNTPRELASLLLAQKPAALAAERDELRRMATDTESPTVRQAAYAGLIVADAGPDKSWELATSRGADHLKSLLAAVPLLPAAPLREAFYAKLAPLVTTGDEPVQAAAIEALGYVPGHEADAFKTLAGVVTTGAGDRRAAAVRSVGRIPVSKWPKDQVEGLANGIVALVEKTPADQRTQPEIVQAVQLGNDLAAALGADKCAPIRKQLRSLAVRVVLIRTLPEQMQYDLRYFTVQAGKPVQIVLQNEDNMPHNIVITAPGGLTDIGTKGGNMPLPEDPKEKPYVPADPKVLQSTHLIPPGEAVTLAFDAPAKPGNYPFLCTYPAHWVKMYGVMQVVEDLDKYDAAPTPPKDPMTRKPYESQKNEASDAAKEPGAAHPGEHKH